MPTESHRRPSFPPPAIGEAEETVCQYCGRMVNGPDAGAPWNPEVQARVEADLGRPLTEPNEGPAVLQDLHPGAYWPAAQLGPLPGDVPGRRHAWALSHGMCEECAGVTSGRRAIARRLAESQRREVAEAEQAAERAEETGEPEAPAPAAPDEEAD